VIFFTITAAALNFVFLHCGLRRRQRGSDKERRINASGFTLQITNSRHAAFGKFPKPATNLTKERKGLMDLTKQYDDAERRFLKNQALELMNNNQPCELHTRTQGSLYRGRVLQADDGGIVFQHEDGRRIVVPISLVEKFVGIPISWSQKTGDLARSAAAGSGNTF